MSRVLYPEEKSNRDPASVPITDDENLVRHVPNDRYIVENPISGTFRLSHAAVREDDVKGAIKDGKKRNLSTIRALAEPEEIVRRSKEISCDEWKPDPVIAATTAGRLRSICRDDFERPLAVYADPTDETDTLGACINHAGASRHKDYVFKDGDYTMADLRDEIAQAFGDLYHLSGEIFTNNKK